MLHKRYTWFQCLGRTLLLALLVSCGSSEATVDRPMESVAQPSDGLVSIVDALSPKDDTVYPDSPYAASRFLAQATFGPTPGSVQQLMNSSYADWIATQQALPLNTLLQAFDESQALNPDSAPSRDWIFESFWRRSVTAEDQLRQRVAFALSQLFVISLRDGGVANSPRGAADFYSRLEQHAFGNFRQLLEEDDGALSFSFRQ